MRQGVNQGLVSVTMCSEEHDVCVLLWGVPPNENHSSYEGRTWDSA